MCDSQAQVSIDETSFQQGNADGKNPTGTKGWLWVVVTPLVCYFQVLLSRFQTAAQTILGSAFTGYVNSDRYTRISHKIWKDEALKGLKYSHNKCFNVLAS